MAFDFGAAGNMKHYNQVSETASIFVTEVCEGNTDRWLCSLPVRPPCVCPQTTPPQYNVQDVKVPTALFSGGQDTLADPKDVAVLLTQVSPLMEPGDSST